MPADVKPYLVPLPETVVWEPWLLETEEQGWITLPDEIDGWDPGTDLRLARRVRVDAVRMLQETGVDPADVAIAVSWTSSSTGMTDAVSPAAMGPDGVAIIDAMLPGERLSGVLTLRSSICLVRRPTAARLGVASIPGSVLAEQTHRVVLENRAPMFPMHAMDFAGTRLPPTASWHLESSTDLLAPFYGVYRVLVNIRDKELGAAVARGVKDKRQQALLDELESGVAMLLLEIALNAREELADRTEWPLETVGDVLARLLDVADLNVNAPPTASDIANFRTQLAGAVRNLGRGRSFS